MAAFGWETLEQWGEDVVRIEPLAGGVANDVWSLRVQGKQHRLEMSGPLLLVDRSTIVLTKEKQAKQLSVSSAEHLSF